MLTRARRGLVIIGNSRTLRSDDHWSKWLDFYAKCASGRARTPSPEKKKAPVNETPEERETRLKKERVEAARRLSMAIRFPGLAMANAQSKERERSRSGSPLLELDGEADMMTKVKGGR